MQKAPYTPFSTEFHGGARAVKSRLESLFAAPRRRGTSLAVAVLLLVTLAGALVACKQEVGAPSPTPSAAPAPEFSNIPASVNAIAQTYVAAKASDDVTGSGLPDFTKAELLRLEPEARFPGMLTGASLSVYALDYRLLSVDSSVPLAGGLWQDEDGWYHQGYTTYLSILEQDGVYSLLGDYSAIDLSIEAEGGWEGILGRMLMSKAAETGDQAMLYDGQKAFAEGWLGKVKTLIADFTGQAESQGEPYVDEAGYTWHKFKDYQDSGLKRLDDAILREAYSILRRDLAVELFNRYVYNPDPIIKQFDDGLYFRADSAAITGLDFTVSTDEFYVTAYEAQGTFQFSVPITYSNGESDYQFMILDLSAPLPVFSQYGILAARDVYPILSYTSADVASALEAAREYFAPQADKQLDALWFDANDLLAIRESYERNGFDPENVMVLLCDYTWLGRDGPLDHGEQAGGWNLIFIRDGADAPWVLNDQGY